MQPLLSIVSFVVTAFVLLYALQGRPSFLLLLPSILLAIVIGWYLHKHIQKEHEENLQKGFTYIKDEEAAKLWMHQSFAPKTKVLLINHIKQTIIYSGLILFAFIFVWSYLVAGLSNALLSVLVTAVLYALFVLYILHVEKWYRFIFKRIPKTYRLLKNSDWIHAYVILLPFTFVCYLFYLAFNYTGNLLATILALPVYLMLYSLVFLCMYCFSYVYKEYQKEQEKKANDVVKKILED